MLPEILLVFAFVCFFLAAVPAIADPWRARLIAVGLTFWVSAELFGHGATLFGVH